jgi:hypothetical protein
VAGDDGRVCAGWAGTGGGAGAVCGGWRAVGLGMGLIVANTPLGMG